LNSSRTSSSPITSSPFFSFEASFSRFSCTDSRSGEFSSCNNLQVVARAAAALSTSLREMFSL
jgi:hypothetical protein